MRIFALLFASLLVTLPASAANRLYKWTDEKGVVHYTDSPPDRREFETRGIGSKEQEEAEKRAQAQEDPVMVAAEARKKNCEQARKNLETLRSSDIVKMDLDGDGKPETLSKEQSEKQAEIARDQIAILCTSSP